MTTSIKNLSPVKYAKIAGLLYLLIAILGMFSIGYVPGVIIKTGEASATVENLLGHVTLFRTGVAADTFVFMIEMILTVMLYQMFKTVNKTLALIATFARFAMIFTMGINLVIYVTPLFFLTDPDFINAYGQEQLNALTMLFFNIHQDGILLWGLFFGLHLIILGYLVYRSGNHPRWIAVFMMVGSLGYLLESFSHFALAPNKVISVLVIIFLSIVVVGEFSFAFWLLIKGLKTPQLRV